MTDRLDARLVILGIWPGAEVQATHTNGATVTGIAVKDPEGWRICHHLSDFTFVYRVPWDSTLSLLLPGEGGGNAHRLERRIQERLAGVEVVPEWCRTLPAAEVSKRLVWLDGLAAKRRWPTGRGAPVCEWERREGWALMLHGVEHTHEPAGGSISAITDPMAALEAVWKRECAP